MRKIPLTQGLLALVDNEDYERCMQFKWCASYGSRGTKVYAKRRTLKGEKARWQTSDIRLHHFILDIAPCELPPGHVVDHVNHDPLDCRKFIRGKIQLEVITQEENMARSPGWKKLGQPALAYAGPDRSDEW